MNLYVGDDGWECEEEREEMKINPFTPTKRNV